MKIPIQLNYATKSQSHKEKLSVFVTL